MKFETERDGQLHFFKSYGIDPDIAIQDNTDGIWNGNILEFKRHINNLNAVLFQAIKYLSKRRVKGKEIPANILLVDLENELVYQYKSENYKNDIQKIYIGAASQNNDDFKAGNYVSKFNYLDMADSIKIKQILKESECMKIDIDENCIVGWAERYYRENPKADKGDFLGDNDEYGKIKKIGEIREPKCFKDYINPYTEKTNEKFVYLMDMLNDRLRKKDLGAFYTPKLYAEKACELVRMAIDRVPEENDYIILDRCAGTGSLEQAVYDVLGPDVASHIVCSTYEYYEYKVLLERVGDFVRTVIPPTEDSVEFNQGCIKNADAMSEEYINNPVIKQYINDKKCNVIIFENPPYRDQSQKNSDEKTKKEEHTDKSFVRDKMSENKSFGPAVNDILNCFVWSAYEYYLRKENDSIVLFAPVKYWKRIHLSEKHFVKGFVFNRKHFHASPEAITCMLFNNTDEILDKITLDIFDINSEKLVNNGSTEIKKSNNVMSRLFDKRKMADDVYENAICCERNGEEAFRKCRFKPYYNTNIIAYLRAESFGFDANSVCLVRNGLHNGNGFYIRSDKYLEGLPLFCAKQIPFDEWYKKGLLDTTSDGGRAYTKDKEFLKRCLIYTCLSSQNKCLSFKGSDGRDYQNELCFDDKALAFKDLRQNVKFGKWTLDNDEKELIRIWEDILTEAKEILRNTTPELFNEGKCIWNLGVYQIAKDVNTSYKDEKGNTVYNYPKLNGNLVLLRNKLKEYYKSHIIDDMFKYELIK